ncbi:MAG: DUF423 domain-containing protein [Balneolaceae bacterium]|nr:MAG: DUF423 domain-containing protein [Balneolaceae bacterium]
MERIKRTGLKDNGVLLSPKTILITGAIFMALAVAFGAFGAHIVQDALMPDRFKVYETAVQYHVYHALGLLILGAVAANYEDSKWLARSAVCLIAGIFIFSGSLYILTLTDTAWLGMITPIGGFLFILGWIFFAIGVIRK